MIPGNVFLAIVKFFLVEHEQIKASSLPLQTLSLKIPKVTMINKVYFH